MCISHISGENIRDVNQKYDQMLISSRYTMSDSRNNDDSRFLCVYCPCPKKKKNNLPLRCKSTQGQNSVPECSPWLLFNQWRAK